MNHSPIILGTSSFTATGWQVSFYPKGLRPAEYLSYYARHFDTVNVSAVRSNLTKHIGVVDLKPVFPGFDNNPRKFPGLIRA